jgi:hypothetical protein
LVGDYVFQNQWISDHKTENSIKGYIVCLSHAALYSLPFILITTWIGCLLILTSHFIIDKYQLGKLWRRIVNLNNSSTTELKENAIPIVIDNTFHLACNYLIISWVS